MKKYMNYVTALPDFIEMQRVSFCWFISQGLTDELANFSSVLDFSGNIEYIFFGQEYKLVKPIYNASSAKRYTANYVAQLIMPIEMRNKRTNTIMRQGRLPIANLPLMTTTATFIINGCERIIVSQVIRSPGVYFEKNKKQKRRKLNKLILSNDFHKVRPFTQTSFGLLKSPNILSLSPIVKTPNFIQRANDLKDIKNTLNFVQFFKIYTIVSKTVATKSKSQRIKKFLKLLKTCKTELITETRFKDQETVEILTYFNNLLKMIIKYQILQTLIYQKKTNQLTSKIFINQYQDKKLQSLYTNKTKKLDFLLNKKTSKLAELNEIYHEEILNDFLPNSKTLYNLYKSEIDTKCVNLWTQKVIQYNKIIEKYQQKTEQFLTNDTILIFHPMIEKLEHTENLPFLKIRLNQNVEKARTIINIFEESKNLKSIIHFPLIKKYRRSDILKNKDYFDKKDIYREKYESKDLYTATLVPEYGSWIRFGFLRDKKTDLYKYPITNRFEDDIVIQIDKITKKPVIHLLREMGLKDLEISKNLEHSDFFYFNSPLLTTSQNSNNPLLRFNIDESYKNISEFSRIFDSRYYRLGKIGRYKLNQRLNLKISTQLSTITYDDLFAIIDYLITLSITKTAGDDIDHLKNRRVRSVGELLQQLFRIGFQRLSRKILSQVYKAESPLILSSNVISATVKEFFGSSQLSQYMDQTNPLASLTHKRRISGLGPGGFDRDRISFAVRDIHPSHYGRICPIETPEGQNVGLIASLTTCARVNESGFLETPFWRVINGKVIKTGKPIYLTADIEDFYKIAPADISTNNENYLTKSSIPVRYKQDFITVSPSEVDFIAISTVQVVSAAASLIPFFEHDDANRALMGSNMQRQSVPLLYADAPLVGTGLEGQTARDSGMALLSLTCGRINSLNKTEVSVKDKKGNLVTYRLTKYQRSNQDTCINQKTLVSFNEKIRVGQIIADGTSTEGGELAVGQNIIIAYMPWEGYNYEDAFVINERLIYEDLHTSIHIEKFEIEARQTKLGAEEITKNLPNLSEKALSNLDENGIINIGSWVESNDILVGKLTPKGESDYLPEGKLLRAIFGEKSRDVRNTSLKLHHGTCGRVLDIKVFSRANNDELSPGTNEIIKVYIAQVRKIQVGDKMAGRHGNKGIISRILPRHDMPHMPDGTPIDIILNPLGIPSRMNVGQILETLLGLAGTKLNKRFKILPFDEMYQKETSRSIILNKLLTASKKDNSSWLFNTKSPGRIQLIDGRTGLPFDNSVLVGISYIVKLIHQIDDKVHARSTGPYSLITQQPLGGRSRSGGQRFGEMEVWALQAFGAAYTLQEILTIKSDDVEGRNIVLNQILKGFPISKPNLPESFKVLICELQSLGLDISLYKFNFDHNFGTQKFELNLLYEYEKRITEHLLPYKSI